MNGDLERQSITSVSELTHGSGIRARAVLRTSSLQPQQRFLIPEDDLGTLKCKAF